MTLKAKLFLAAALLCIAQGAHAAGNHFGWCNGVGNQHRGSNCGGSGSQTPTTTPAQVPTSTQQPQTGPGVLPTPQATPTQVIVVAPPQTITGTGQVPPVQGQPGPTITGSNPLIVLQPLPPQVLTGTAPARVTTLPTPSFTGTAPIITIQPQPPQTVTGYGNVSASITVRADPSQSFSGFGAVPFPQPPGAIPRQIPQAIPSQTTQGTPYLIPSLQGPQATPGQMPQATPAGVPQAVPGQVPQPTQVLLPRPNPRPSAQRPTASGGPTTHSQTAKTPPVAARHITAAPGRQPQHDPPQFADAEGGANWHCLASGHGQRKSLVNRRVEVSGALRDVGSIDLTGRDLPALHSGHANCIISIKRNR